ncbi:unnamed protein product [Urochloa humidicola]
MPPSAPWILQHPFSRNDRVTDSASLYLTSDWIESPSQPANQEEAFRRSRSKKRPSTKFCPTEERHKINWGQLYMLGILVMVAILGTVDMLCIPTLLAMG